MSEQPILFISGDGSHSLISSIYDTAYHSTHGALTESTVVFIKAGLDYLKERNYDQISIFEMGFGTGLNAILAYNWGIKNHTPLNYRTVEAYPISLEMASSLNYGTLCEATSIFQSLHELSWNQIHDLTPSFHFCKYLSKLESLQITETFDVIFYDAFAPANQPELWNIDILSKMWQILNDGGVLVSFCAQGAFKRNLRSSGFVVEAIPGPPGKREMTRAFKK